MVKKRKGEKARRRIENRLRVRDRRQAMNSATVVVLPSHGTIEHVILTNFHFKPLSYLQASTQHTSLISLSIPLVFGCSVRPKLNMPLLKAQTISKGDEAKAHLSQ
jgi:hypothetical protein